MTLPAVGTPGRSSDRFFSNGPLLATAVALACYAIGLYAAPA